MKVAYIKYVGHKQETWRRRRVLRPNCFIHNAVYWCVY
jgi:hypothetical protein